VPTRAGYAFDDWYNTAGVKASSTMKVSGNMSLTARWTATHAFLKSLKASGGKFKQGLNTAIYKVKVTRAKK